MQNTIEEFRLLFNRKMEQFIDWRLRGLNYETIAYAQKIVHSYRFSDAESLALANSEIESFLDFFEQNLTKARPMLGEGVDVINASEEENIESEL